MKLILLAVASVIVAGQAWAGQAPYGAQKADIPISHRDRFYTADQFSNTVSVIDPAENKLLGVIRLGDPTPANVSPLYRGQLLVHGMGFSPDTARSRSFRSVRTRSASSTRPRIPSST